MQDRGSILHNIFYIYFMKELKNLYFFCLSLVFPAFSLPAA